MTVEMYVVGQVQTNCYFVGNEETKELLIVDPGDMGSALIQKVKEGNWNLVAILLTHGHFDHVGGVKALVEEFDVPVYIHEEDKKTLEDPTYNVSWMIGKEECYQASEFLKDEQELDLAGFHIRVLFTPGHTPGGCCYYFPYQEVVFTGDSLFCGSIGRTDFKGGSMSQLVRAVKDKLMVLPERTTVYPGHNDVTSIESERMYNPYL